MGSRIRRLSDLQFLGNFRLFERSEFENFRKENCNKAKNSGLSGCTFLCSLSFVQAKESESHRQNPIFKKANLI